ncbi:hypothetical protein B0T25DRAFT_161506 [Lasiosphaeria hispida]|uniref:Uncharacterized protein n=1 Tax=Lasiosphaeria hispida TaxID=260671 RepID=A0AAJ0HMJ9_9PEZI|nr:hypothetical protein B0T25DRAFT_161506 [Lasiosphaeria hispida]
MSTRRRFVWPRTVGTTPVVVVVVVVGPWRDIRCYFFFRFFLLFSYPLSASLRLRRWGWQKDMPPPRSTIGSTQHSAHTALADFPPTIRLCGRVIAH